MLTNEPLVSVLMTAYNREKYIEEAIESVLDSTYSNFELIIVDDGSTDKTVEIARRYQLQDNRVKVYVNEGNLGDYPNRNRAASLAKGKYLKYLDSDDKIYEDGLAYSVAQMEEYAGASLGVYCPYSMDRRLSVCKPSDLIIKDHFFTQHYLSIGPTGAIYNRHTFEKVGGFDVRFGVASDMFFNLKMALVGPVVLLSYLFVFYRVHDGQERNNKIGYLKNGYLYLKEALEKLQLPLTTQQVNYLYRKMQKRHSVNIVRTWWQTKDFSIVRQVMKQTGFSYLDFFSSFLK